MPVEKVEESYKLDLAGIVIKKVTDGAVAKVSSVKDGTGHPVYQEVLASLAVFEKEITSVISTVPPSVWGPLLNLLIDKLNLMLHGAFTPAQVESLKAAIAALIQAGLGAEQIVVELAPAAGLLKAEETGLEDKTEDKKEQKKEKSSK